MQSDWPTTHHRVVDMVQDQDLIQVQDNPTREKNRLDLMLTNRPALVKNVTGIPGTSDRDIGVMDSNIWPIYNKPKPHQDE